MPLPLRDQVPRSLERLLEVLCWTSDWFFGFVMLLAVIAFIYAAFLFFTSGGSPEKVGNAKKMLFYGLLGTVIGILAKSSIYFIGDLLGVVPEAGVGIFDYCP